MFLSHDWGTDDQGRPNHERVSRVNAALQAAGLVTWFDEERMHGDIVEQMTDGIDRSSLVLVFVTSNYLKKVAGEGPGGANDNCKAEFDYTCNRKGVERMLAVVMEPSCTDTREWRGAVGMRLGSKLYQNLSSEGAQLEEEVAGLLVRLRSELTPLTATDAPASDSGREQVGALAVLDSAKEGFDMPLRKRSWCLRLPWHAKRTSRLFFFQGSTHEFENRVRGAARAIINPNAWSESMTAKAAWLPLLVFTIFFVVFASREPKTTVTWTRRIYNYESINCWCCAYAAVPLLFTVCTWAALHRTLFILRDARRLKLSSRAISQRARTYSWAELQVWLATASAAIYSWLMFYLWFWLDLAGMIIPFLQIMTTIVGFFVTRNLRDSLIAREGTNMERYLGGLAARMRFVLAIQGVALGIVVATVTQVCSPFCQVGA